MRLGGSALILILGLAAAPARADDDTSTIISELSVTAKPRSTSLSGVEVAQPKVCLPARNPPDKDVPAPRLVTTYPAAGQVVRPGLMVLRLSFDLPMACQGSLGTRFLNADPCESSGGLQNWRLSYDRMHLRILCRVKPGQRYSLWINRHNAEDFRAVGGLKPEPYELSFSVSDGAPVATVEEAVRIAAGGGLGKPQPAAGGAGPVKAATK